ncbi:acyl-CoA dehydrogenase family protein [Pseudonocardia sp. KRD-184]|uniref:Acyl-CoA dehydrogenase family protein n=1 Tax=Pseudonocardia oceani TaxID=2792013 RepID=A0ABS6U2B5_9PSEU|nr:acyl-CoA dehydrogenase family protein [Pseudonocardia oceani]MBW0091149.1 acyl-CoA dehydrogenase family protein [Pseudonocardia oceani]MBW0095066.1 acyl-CoA dehydrogenase family protein [Pseudonocardia oceani]MBW0107197.1 acyl-CoA dehydrogenase family protein [Pseudonocardia oceani]MBW0119707.1 acyl-CoA dehydrogenase family protein [Pseudonocardia oceani]MBW0126370.1 acyl-CoA dehydrogenase family protein [Pseudonocardia oceani]
MDLTPAKDAWQREVRDVLLEHLTPELRAALPGWRETAPVDRHPAVRRLLETMAARGWFGIGVPAEYGGQGRSAVEQFLFFEACDYLGTPHPDLMTTVSVGPTIARAGTDEQRRRWLPGIVSGGVEFALGYSEDAAGTDLANLRCRAVRDGDHWVVDGHKLWNTGAHHATHEWLACRTDPDAPRHRGISILAVPLDSPGITVRALPTWGGLRTNEVTFTGVRVPADHLIGEAGQGWAHITTALALERVGIAGVGTLRRLFDGLVAELGAGAGPDGAAAVRLAELETRVRAVRLLALRTLGEIDAGRLSDADAAMLKVAATELVAELSDAALEMCGERSRLATGEPGSPLGGFAELTYRRAPYLRFGGGTNEVQRTMVAQRRYGLPTSARSAPAPVGRAGRRAGESSEHRALRGSTAAFLRDHVDPRRLARGDAGHRDALWTAVCGQGWPVLAVPQVYGGAGAAPADLAVVLAEAARAALPSTLRSTAAAALALALAGSAEQRRRWLPRLATGAATVAAPPELLMLRAARGAGTDGAGYRLDGDLHRLDDATPGAVVVAVAVDDTGATRLVAVDTASDGVTVTPLRSVSGEPLGAVACTAVAIGTADVSAPLRPHRVDDVADVCALLAAVELVGLGEELLERTVAHVTTREQFGRPIGTFQAVAHHVADMGSALECARMLVDAALADLGAGRPARRSAAAAKARAGRAATAISRLAHQLHGAIGYVTESDLHLYSRRATAVALSAGTASEHLAFLARRYRADRPGTLGLDALDSPDRSVDLSRRSDGGTMFPDQKPRREASTERREAGQ